MPSGLRKTSGNNFEIYLEQPWGGVASDKEATDIQDNQFSVCQGLIDVNGLLCTPQLVTRSDLFLFNPHVTNAYPVLIFEITQYGLTENVTSLYAADQFGYIYIYNISVGSFSFLTGSSDSPWSSPNYTPDSVQILNGLAYISVFNRNSIYVFDPVAVTFTLASNFAGGKILGILDGYLLQLNTNNATDGIKPTRVNWSGPGKFSTWDPGSDRTAGFNTLVNIQDAITGFISLASVGIIIGKKGLVEASPTGVAIQPFNFTTLWTSNVGMGTPYPLTVCQYGQNTYLLSNTSAYKISTAGFQDVSGVARKAILNSLQIATDSTTPINITLAPIFFAGLFQYAYDLGYPTPFFVVGQAAFNNTGGLGHCVLVLWFLNLDTGAWYSIVVNYTNYISEQTGAPDPALPIQLRFTTLNDYLGQYGANSSLPLILLHGGVKNDIGSTISPVISTINLDVDGLLPAQDLITPVILKSKVWEIKPYREPTIRRILVKAAGVGFLALDINGVSFGAINMTSTNVLTTYLSITGVYTGQNPQLTMNSSNFRGYIEKIVLIGTFGDGDID